MGARIMSDIRTITRTVTRSCPSVIRTVDDIKALYRATQPDGHWFDADTMRYWGTRIMNTVNSDGQGGAYFVTSEPQAWNSVRAYTVRHINGAGKVTTAGHLFDYGTRDQALRAAARMASENQA